MRTCQINTSISNFTIYNEAMSQYTFMQGTCTPPLQDMAWKPIPAGHIHTNLHARIHAHLNSTHHKGYATLHQNTNRSKSARTVDIAGKDGNALESGAKPRAIDIHGQHSAHTEVGKTRNSDATQSIEQTTPNHDGQQRENSGKKHDSSDGSNSSPVSKPPAETVEQVHASAQSASTASAGEKSSVRQGDASAKGVGADAGGGSLSAALSPEEERKQARRRREEQLREAEVKRQ
jgi:hypothetical protein